MEAVEIITDTVEQKKFSIGIFIDLKKAFDTIDHNILCYKLEKLGVRGIALDWIKSYLNGRYQYVQVAGIKSRCLNTICGVP